MVVQAQADMGEGSANLIDPQHILTINQPSSSQPPRKQKPRSTKIKDTEVPQPSDLITNVVNEAFNEEMDDSLERAATTATSLDAKQDRGNINKTQSKATPNEPSSLGTSSGGVNTPQSGEHSLKLTELMEFYTKLQQRVIDLENTKTTQAQEITSLKLRVKKLEKKGGSRTHKLKRLYKIGRSARDMAEKEINVAEKEVSTADPVTTAGEVVTTSSVEVSTASPNENLTDDVITLAQALAALKSEKPKEKGDVVIDPVAPVSTATTTIVTIPTPRKGIVITKKSTPTRTRSQQLPSKDKEKGKMEELEKPIKRKDQIRHDKEVAQRL
ncbi:hypothetical protein Tco_0962193 [Tanacetum coccineum]